MMRRGRSSFLCATLCAVLGAGAMVIAAPVRADTLIESIIVKWRDDAAPRDTAVLPEALRHALSDALGKEVTVTGRARDGAFKLLLPAPLAQDEARLAINRARMTLPVVYVGMVAPARSTPRVAPQDAAQSRVQPPITRLIVRFRDPAVAQLSR